MLSFYVRVFLTFDFFTGDADGINFGNGLQEAVKEVGEEQKTYLARWKPVVFFFFFSFSRTWFKYHGKV